MKHSNSTSKTWRRLGLLLIAPLLILPGCAGNQPVPSSWPELPARPSVTMPPTQKEVLTSVQSDLAELEKQREARVQRLMRSMPDGLPTKNSKAD